jgi:hypothetical protein
MQGIHAVLIQNESTERLLDHLWWIETTNMGLCGNRENTAQAVGKLISIRVQLQSRV